MIKIIAVLCSLSSPKNCYEQTVTSSDLDATSVQSCLMGARQLADWMKQHPAARLAAWRCMIGKQDGRGPSLSARSRSSGSNIGQDQRTFGQYRRTSFVVANRRVF